MALCVVATIAYAGYVTWQVGKEFGGRRWDLPAQVYAAPLELYPGRALAADDLVSELKRLGYREDPRLARPGTYRVALQRVEVSTRGFDFAGDTELPQPISLGFAGGKIATLRRVDGADAAIARLDPLLIGSLFPAHGEDRLIVAPAETPPLLPAALIAIEDRRFADHHGVDLRAMLRAAFVNLSAGEIKQGASTLTQQLVRSYFLSNERSWTRKLHEAFMAVALELRYDKPDLMQAYINEIYLGQDGDRAVHGFGLASQFYFGQPARRARAARARAARRDRARTDLLRSASPSGPGSRAPQSRARGDGRREARVGRGRREGRAAQARPRRRRGAARRSPRSSRSCAASSPWTIR